MAQRFRNRLATLPATSPLAVAVFLAVVLAPVPALAMVARLLAA